jgi:hypothetical protein
MMAWLWPYIVRGTVSARPFRNAGRSKLGAFVMRNSRQHYHAQRFLGASYLKAAALASALLLATAGAPATAGEGPERIVSCQTLPTGITVTVETGGCTARADFLLSTNPAGAKTDIELRRTKPDTCKGNFPDGLKLQFSWADLKLAPGSKFALQNQPLPGPDGKKSCAGTVPVAAGIEQTVTPAQTLTPAKTYQHKRWHRRHRHRHHNYDCDCICDF